MNLRHPLRFIRRTLNAIYSIEPMHAHIANVEKSLAFQRVWENRQKTTPPLLKNQFAIFNYSFHFLPSPANLGDEIQTIATQNALNSICENPQFSYVSRDFLQFAGGGG